MAIAIGNKTQSNQNPNGSSQTLSHNQNAGTDRGLLVVITMSSSANFSGCTYNGTAMTLIRNDFYSAESQRTAAYYLQNPDTGANNIVVSFTGPQYSSTSIFAVSFTGAGNVDAHASTGPTTTPSSQSLTIATNSIIYATGISGNAQNTQYDIGGTARPFEFSHNTNRQVRGALSATGLSAGATNVTTKADFANITNFRIAIGEASAPPPTRRRIIV